jgi:hypothetical protein
LCYQLLFVLFCVLFVCKCVLYCCHRVSNKNAVDKYITYRIISYIHTHTYTHRHITKPTHPHIHTHTHTHTEKTHTCYCVVLLLFVLFSVLFVCKCILYYCHRVSNKNAVDKYIIYHITYHIISYTHIPTHYKTHTHTHSHVTKQVKTTTVQVTHQIKCRWEATILRRLQYQKSGRSYPVAVCKVHCADTQCSCASC